MQEHHPYKITPDQGWAKMKPILDKAMPEDTHKRRYPGTWWSVSAVVVAAVMGLLVIDDKPIASEHSVKGEPQTISPVTNYKATLSTDQTASPAITPAIKEKVSVQGTITNDNPKPAQQSSSTLKQNSIPTSNSSLPVKSSQTTTAEKAIPMAMITEPMSNETFQPTSLQPTEESTYLSSDETESVEELSTGIVMIYEEKYRDAHVLEPLPQLSIASVVGDGASDQILTGEAMKSKWKTPFVEPTLAVSGLAGLNGGAGISGGIGVNLNVAKRFSVTTSVGYLSYNPNSFLSDGLKALDSNAEYNTIVNYDPSYIGNETYVDAGNVNNKAGYNAINPLIDKLTQWQVTTGVKWKATPRFFTEGGVQFGLNTQACSEYPIVATSQPGNAPPPLRFNNSLDDYDVIRSSTTALYLGVGYRIGQHFDVFTNWTHGLNQYILNDTNEAAESYSEERTDYIRGLSLGLRYTL